MIDAFIAARFFFCRGLFFFFFLSFLFGLLACSLTRSACRSLARSTQMAPPKKKKKGASTEEEDTAAKLQRMKEKKEAALAKLAEKQGA